MSTASVTFSVKGRYAQSLSQNNAAATCDFRRKMIKYYNERRIHAMRETRKGTS